MKKFTYILFSIIFVFHSCIKDDDFLGDPQIGTGNNPVTDQQFQQDNFGNTLTTNFIGQIINANGLKLKDVQVTIGNQTTFTDHNGVFVLNNASVYEKFAYVKATKNGYIQGSRTIVPSQNGTNDIQITLLEKTITGTVSSGASSEVSLPNGSKVAFQGGFIDATGNAYTGQVAVSLHYLEPNQETTFTEMPGMLFGQRENGNASGMETYGMLSVNLYAPNGEALNIAETSPATLTFPVASSTAEAPETIALWYFDEAAGYWKEQGQAIKTGNAYIAEVTHFTWWNCDIPFDAINVCFTVTNENALTNLRVEIIRNATGQIIYRGYTNGIGEECGPIPRNEEVTIHVYGNSECLDTVIYSENRGPFLNDTSFNINIPSLPLGLGETTLVGTLNNCNGEAIINGYALVFSESNVNTNLFSITNGSLNASFAYCDAAIYNIIVIDLDSSQVSESITLDLIENDITNINTVTTCEQMGGTYFGNVHLTSQEEVDAFSLLGFEIIEGSVDISPINTTTETTNITNLNSLSSITSISEFLIVDRNNALQDLTGLDNLSFIGQYLSIQSNNILSSISALNNLTAAGSLYIYENPLLTSLEGLNSLTTAGVLYIYENSLLTSLEGLNNLTTVEYEFSILNNVSLTTLDGLENLTSTGGLVIYENPLLTTIEALGNLNSIVRDGLELVISTNASLTTLEGLENLTSIRALVIANNSLLTTIEALGNITNYGGGRLSISSNNSLASLVGLEGINTVSSFTTIVSMPLLTSLEGLNNLTSVGSLDVRNNASLTSLNGLETLISADGVLKIGHSFWPNLNLSDLCALTNLFTNGTYDSAEVSIENNAYNPTVQDIIDGNCSQ